METERLVGRCHGVGLRDSRRNAVRTPVVETCDHGIGAGWVGHESGAGERTARTARGGFSVHALQRRSVIESKHCASAANGAAWASPHGVHTTRVKSNPATGSYCVAIA